MRLHFFISAVIENSKVDYCQKMEKSQNLLKLITSSVRGGRRGPNKICAFSKNCKKFSKVLEERKISVFLHLKGKCVIIRYL